VKSFGEHKYVQTWSLYEPKC